METISQSCVSSSVTSMCPQNWLHLCRAELGESQRLTVCFENLSCAPCIALVSRTEAFHLVDPDANENGVCGSPRQSRSQGDGHDQPG